MAVPESAQIQTQLSEFRDRHAGVDLDNRPANGDLSQRIIPLPWTWRTHPNGPGMEVKNLGQLGTARTVRRICGFR